MMRVAIWAEQIIHDFHLKTFCEELLIPWPWTVTLIFLLQMMNATHRPRTKGCRRRIQTTGIFFLPLQSMKLPRLDGIYFDRLWFLDLPDDIKCCTSPFAQNFVEDNGEPVTCVDCEIYLESWVCPTVQINSEDLSIPNVLHQKVTKRLALRFFFLEGLIFSLCHFSHNGTAAPE